MYELGWRATASVRYVNVRSGGPLSTDDDAIQRIAGTPHVDIARLTEGVERAPLDRLGVV